MEIKSTITVNTEKIISELVENGVVNGIAKARKINPQCSDEFIKDHIVIAVMKELNNYIKWE